jgi:hypothetical protein
MYYRLEKLSGSATLVANNLTNFFSLVFMGAQNRHFFNIYI